MAPKKKDIKGKAGQKPITFQPGGLHKSLGVPQGQPIPAAKMEAAKASASPAERKRITFAENASKWHH